MKPTKLYLLLLLLALMAMPRSVHAQSDLQISKVFDIYGKKKGVVMVELSDEMLGSYDLSLFKSIIIRNDPAAADFIRKCIEKDQEGAKKIKQVMANGTLSTIFLQLPRKGKENRMILYNQTNAGLMLTLVYLESETNVDDLMNLLLKKK
jgi:hypothetical protein